MENPELITERIFEWNAKANKLADEKYEKILEAVGLDK
jgi:hypothetical protein